MALLVAAPWRLARVAAQSSALVALVAGLISAAVEVGCLVFLPGESLAEPWRDLSSFAHDASFIALVGGAVLVFPAGLVLFPLAVCS
ncbi:MAG: hypothetical protein L0Y44_10775 [Phycisphaerales bacterium]|nr:hypothetical protein [Phycisphaerales bacterium]